MKNKQRQRILYCCTQYYSHPACLLSLVKIIPTQALFIKTLIVLINSVCVGIIFTSDCIAVFVSAFQLRSKQNFGLVLRLLEMLFLLVIIHDGL
jgi:hypothetical protein